MAETKTTIPVEIKMGNAGTNDSNLPAFKEGSIIFTKDTKKIYIDPVGETKRIAVGGGEVDLSGKQDKFADLDYVWDGNSFKYLSLNLKSASKNTSSTSGAFSIVSDLRFGTETGDQVRLTVGSIIIDPVNNGRYSSILNNTSLSFKDQIASTTLPSMLITPAAHNGTTPAQLTLSSPAQNLSVGHANVRLTGIAAPTTDADAVNKGYLTTKYGSTYYEPQGKKFYLPGGSNMVIPNTNMGRLYIGPENATSTDFKIYVNDPIDDGKLIITNLKAPSADNDAANKAYVDSKVNGLIPEIFEFQGTPTTNPDIKFNHDTSTSTPGGFRLLGASGMGISFDGYYENNMLGYRMSAYGPNPILLTANVKKASEATITTDNDITDKKYVDDIKTELLNAITHPYTYDETTKELTLIL